MKIVFLDESTISLNGDMDFSSIEAIGELICYPHSNERETIDRALGAETVIVNKVPMTAKIISRLPDLRHIAVIATGYNNVDLRAAAKANILITNVEGYAKFSVPQHTFALILNLSTHVHDYYRDVREGAWQKASSFNLLSYPTFELVGKSIGIIGFGAIGQGVASIAKGFGMEVLVHDPVGCVDTECRNCTLVEIFEQADIVSLHCPLTAENKHLINTETLKTMKSSAILINTARGGLVDETALLWALKSGEIAGAGLDVLSEEPPKENPLLGDVHNLIVTPHCAWTAREARQRLIDEVAENIKAISEGRARNVVRV